MNPFLRSKYNLKDENIVFTGADQRHADGTSSISFICERCNNRKLFSRSAVINHLKSNIHRGIINSNTPKDILQIWLQKL